MTNTIILMVSMVLYRMSAPLNSPAESGQLPVRVDIGTPDTDCTGSGLCSVSLDFNWRMTDRLVRYRGFGSASLISGRLEIRILKRSLDTYTKRHYFSGPDFIMGSALSAQPMLVEALGIPSYTVAAGNYPLRQDKEAYILLF